MPTPSPHPLKVGFIGYGHRVANLSRGFDKFDIPWRIEAIADPRAEAIRAGGEERLARAAFFEDADSMLAEAELDGIVVGTRCGLHAEMACKAAGRGLPILLEKPVATDFDQIRMLLDRFRDYDAPIVVSFPLRVSPLCQAVKSMIDAGEIGQPHQVVAFNDVNYGRVYFRWWLRDNQETGGMFLQKATHDLDYIFHLTGQKASRVAAMKARRVYGGDKPWDLKCNDCPDEEQCPESPFNLYRRGFEQDSVQANRRDDYYCMFAEGHGNEDMGACLIELENGAQVSYTQNFFVRKGAGRRGARLLGERGTIEFDFGKGQARLWHHHKPSVQTFEFERELPHYGGDHELGHDFLMAMREGRPSRTPLQAGIHSALTCLWARESARSNRFCEVQLPRS